MTLIIPFVASLIAIVFSIFHPGGWLGLSGLIIAIKTRKYVWLTLSLIGATLTGMTVPFLEGIGASAL